MTKKLIRLRDYVPENGILKLEKGSKADVLLELAKQYHELGEIEEETGSQKLYHQLLKREQLGSTGIIPAIAIPHCKSDVIRSEMTILVGWSSEGVSFDSQDGNPVHLLFSVVTRKDLPALHLGALAAISRLISRHGLSAGVQQFLDPTRLREIIDECEYEV